MNAITLPMITLKCLFIAYYWLFPKEWATSSNVFFFFYKESIQIFKQWQWIDKIMIFYYEYVFGAQQKSKRKPRLYLDADTILRKITKKSRRRSLTFQISKAKLNNRRKSLIDMLVKLTLVSTEMYLYIYHTYKVRNFLKRKTLHRIYWRKQQTTIKKNKKRRTIK